MTTMNFNQTMSPSDLIMASLECNGKELVRFSQNNFSSIDEVVRAAFSAAGHFAGLARLTVRNATQGWSRAIALASRIRLNVA